MSWFYIQWRKGDGKCNKKLFHLMIQFDSPKNVILKAGRHWRSARYGTAKGAFAWVDQWKTKATACIMWCVVYFYIELKTFGYLRSSANFKILMLMVLDNQEYSTMQYFQDSDDVILLLSKIKKYFCNQFKKGWAAYV